MSIAAHDHTYLIDYSVEQLVSLQEEKDVIADYVITQLQKYEQEHFAKFIGAGLPTDLQTLSPSLNSRLWLDIDIIPIDFDVDKSEASFWEDKNVDEQADSMARKCVM